MLVTFTGKPHEFTKEQTAKLAARIDKIGKLIDGRNEKKAHVILNKQRHLHKAEVTINYYGTTIVGMSTGTDEFHALYDAVHKLEAQTLKMRKKWIDGKRGSEKPNGEVAAAAPVVAAAKPEKRPKMPRLYRVRLARGAKPMSAEEASLEVGKRDKYFVFEDSESGELAVLARREDGAFDLLEI